MAEPALKTMTVDEFLLWEDGTDTRYELIGGFIVAMAQAMPAHGRLAAALGGEIRAALRGRSPCFAQSEAGIVRPDRNDTCCVADLAVSSEQLGPEDPLIRAPVLIVEIPSRSTSVFGRQTKVADYRQMASAGEILLIDSESVFAEILRRDGDRWVTEIARGPDATLAFRPVPLRVAMADLYEGVPLPQPRTETAAIG